MSARASFGAAILAALLGGIAGSALGQIVHQLWPSNAVAHVLGASVLLGLEEPLRIDVGVLRLSFALALRLNLPGVAGVVLGAWLALRHP